MRACSFDIIWAEGSIGIIGSERGFREWKRLLKTHGFLVIHDDDRNMSDKLETITNCGYKLINHFLLPEDAWWTEYYEPLETQIKELNDKYKNNPEARKRIEKGQNEIEMAKNARAKKHGSVFYLMQKFKES